jgi:hypothetical protein
MQGGGQEIPTRLPGRKRKAANEVLDHVLPIYDTLPIPSDLKVLTKQAMSFVDNPCVPMGRL